MGHACWSQLNENILHLRAGVNNCENIHKSKLEMNLDKPELMCAIDHHHSPSTFPLSFYRSLFVSQICQIYCHVTFTD